MDGNIEARISSIVLSDDELVFKAEDVNSNQAEILALKERVRLLEQDLESSNQEVQKYYEIAQTYENSSRQWELRYLEALNKQGIHRALPSDGLALPEVNDKLLLRRWDEIDTLVQSFVNKHFGVNSWSGANSNLPASFLVLTPNSRYWINSPLLRPFLLQSWIYQTVLGYKKADSHRFDWLMDNVDMYLSLEKEMVSKIGPLHEVHTSIKQNKIDVAELKLYLKWRALVASISWERYSSGGDASSKRRSDRVVNEWIALLGQFTKNKETIEFQLDMMNIIKKHMSFENLTTRTLAIVHRGLLCINTSIGQVSHGFNVEGSDKRLLVAQKEFASEELDTIVEMSIRPFLIRIGNHAGDGYEVQTILSKGTVIVRKARMARMAEERMEQ
jgi:hypothetical protein